VDVLPEEDWDAIHGFGSPGEFERFRRWIAEAAAEGVLQEVAVEAPYGGSRLFDERWYRTASGRRWRVVAPDPPFLGVFEPAPDPGNGEGRAGRTN
jgi:hypothetical protein